MIGAICGNALRGMGIGFAAGAVYVVARKGKEVSMPEKTGLLTRLDSTLVVSVIAADNSNDPTNVATAAR